MIAEASGQEYETARIWTSVNIFDCYPTNYRDLNRGQYSVTWENTDTPPCPGGCQTHAASFRAVKDRVPPYTKRHVASEVRKLLHTASHTQHKHILQKGRSRDVLMSNHLFNLLNRWTDSVKFDIREALLWLMCLVAGFSSQRPVFFPRAVYKVGVVANEWHWDRFLSENFVFPLWTLLPQRSMLIHSLLIDSK